MTTVAARPPPPPPRGGTGGTGRGTGGTGGKASRGRGGRGAASRGRGAASRGRVVRFGDIQNHINAHSGSGTNPKYSIALNEIQNDCKKDKHWIWYIFPQVKGLSTTTPNPGSNQDKYDINNLEHAKSFLENNTLRQHYLEISKEVLTCLNNLKTLNNIFDGNYKKVISSWTLFHYAAKEKLKDNNANEKDDLDEIIKTIEEANTKNYFDYDSNTYSKLGSQPTTAATATATATTAATATTIAVESGGPPPTSTATTATTTTPTTTTIRTAFIPVTSPTTFIDAVSNREETVKMNNLDIKFKIYTAKDGTEIYEFTSDAEKGKMIQVLKSYY